MRTLFWLAGQCVPVLLCAAACATSRSTAEVVISARAEPASTAIGVEASADRAVITVDSPAGIGRADVEIISGPVPRQMWLQLNLRGLEQLQLAYGDTTLIASISSQPGNEVREAVRLPGTDLAQDEPILPGSDYWMAMTIVATGDVSPTVPLEHGYIQVEVPRDFLQGEYRAFSVRWVDFFR